MKKTMTGGLPRNENTQENPTLQAPIWEIGERLGASRLN
ncbi:MAG: hypothetical protein CM15mP49_03800 [Actinomycetota bacterium]|nr:MAG: hypothetical protein CM15mP49_03800 [Actinomycetota bacterium]